VGRTLLSDVFDVAVILLLPLGLNLPVWVGHSCPTSLTLRLILLLPLGLNLPVWVGHSCPTPLTLRFDLALAVGLKLSVWVGHSCPTPLTLSAVSLPGYRSRHPQNPVNTPHPELFN
jgi:hypothetical protein